MQSPDERLQVEAKLDHRFEQIHDSGFQLIIFFRDKLRAVTLD